jgi:hypothetical protein
MDRDTFLATWLERARREKQTDALFLKAVAACSELLDEEPAEPSEPFLRRVRKAREFLDKLAGVLSQTERRLELDLGTRRAVGRPRELTEAEERLARRLKASGTSHGKILIQLNRAREKLGKTPLNPSTLKTALKRRPKGLPPLGSTPRAR